MATRTTSENIQERFEDKYIPVTECGCWLWIAKTKKFSNGNYGIIWLDDKWKYAHRVSWELTHGKIPDGLDVLHKCDEPSCVNPSHLFIGTQADNNLDRDRKGRQVAPRGIHNGNAKLTDEQVVFIRNSKESSIQLSKVVGIASSGIRKIRRGEAWRHVHGD